MPGFSFAFCFSDISVHGETFIEECYIALFFLTFINKARFVLNVQDSLALFYRSDASFLTFSKIEGSSPLCQTFR